MQYWLPHITLQTNTIKYSDPIYDISRETFSSRTSKVCVWCNVLLYNRCLLWNIALPLHCKQYHILLSEIDRIQFVTHLKLPNPRKKNVFFCKSVKVLNNCLRKNFLLASAIWGRLIEFNSNEFLNFQKEYLVISLIKSFSKCIAS